MIVPDINLLAYAHNSSAIHHQKARAWWEQCLNGTEPVGLAMAVALGFVRLLSSPKVVPYPVRLEHLVRAVTQWLDCPNVRTIGPGPRHPTLMESLFQNSGAGSSLTTDLHLTVLAQELDAVLHSNDTDFLRFPGLKVVNPLAEL